MALTPAVISQLKADDKVRTFREIQQLIRSLNSSGTTVILAQGVFDIVHRGHVGYLQAARKVNPRDSILIVGLENDRSVRQNKGGHRPINPLEDRLHVIAEFMSVGLVFGYEDTPDYTQPREWIQRYKALGPATIVAANWDPQRNLKKQQAREAGSQLAFVNYRHTNSTTAMLQKLGYRE